MKLTDELSVRMTLSLLRRLILFCNFFISFLPDKTVKVKLKAKYAVPLVSCNVSLYCAKNNSYIVSRM